MAEQPPQYRSEILESALMRLHVVVEGIKASVIVSNEGLLVASFPPGNEGNAQDNPTSSPQVAAMAATLIGLAEKTLWRLAQGDLDRILMEGEEGRMLVYPAGSGTSIAVLLSKDARLERAFFATSRAAEEVAEILSTSTS
ncbi:MAG: roadblock/LC7 domain-containing protein [Anaerolineae bacterium]|nr:roadblock/LC7 domain-containing protein [Anaerolineae bacterium]